MKVGIITVHKSNNYGACLQSYALWRYISSLGYDCEIIDLHRPLHDDFIPSKRFCPLRAKKKKNIFKRILSSTKSILFPKKGKTKLSLLAKQRFDIFNNQIRFSRPYRGIDELYSNPPEYDIYVSGSDQIWNPTMPYCIEPYFLGFIKNGGRKISYASSVGLSELLPNEKKCYREWLADYDSISVREETGREIISRITQRTDIFQVSDPTFLLDIDEWEKQIVPVNTSSRYILLFILSYNPSLIEFCKKLKKASGYDVMIIYNRHQNSSLSEFLPITDAGPCEFLGYIKNADLVITDSFHGTVFSILLKTNFFTYVGLTNKRGSRITDLLEKFNLSSHLLELSSQVPSFGDLMKVSYKVEDIERAIAKERSQSREYLMSALLGNKKL